MGHQTRFWRKWRVRFRRFRIAILSLALALVCAVFWLTQIGLPDFLKRPLVESLRARGVELQFVRLHLSFIHGVVADNVRIGGETPDSPSLSVQKVQLQLDFPALLHRKLQLDGLVLRQGKLELPFSTTNEPPRALTLDGIQTDLRFQTNGIWSLDHFQAAFAGAKLTLSGEVAHATEIRDWEIFRRTKTGGAAAQQPQLKKIADVLDQIHFAGAAQLNLVVRGDAQDIHSFQARLSVRAPDVKTPWGQAQDIELAANLSAPKKNPDNFDSSWAFWTNVQLFAVEWTARLAHLESKQLDADSIGCGGFWRAPELAVTNLSAQLGGGRLDARARLNVASREFTFTNSSRFDLHAVAAFWTKKTRARLKQFSWAQPPEMRGSGSLILPAWTNRAPDWRAEVQPTIRLNGELAMINAAFNGFWLDVARAHFSYSNLVWNLPDIVITRPEGQLKIGGGENDSTKNYHWHVHGAFSPGSIKPFVTSAKAVREFNRLTFAEPLFLDADVRGRLYDYDSISASGHAALTNFSVRGESIDSVEAEFHYANRVAEFFQPRVQAGAQTMQADGIRLDFPAQRIYFTNGLATADPRMVASAIGPKIGEVMEPYHFLKLPTARVNGYAPLREAEDADLNFEIIGGAPLEWLKLKTTRISGDIHWLGQTLILTNVSAALYDGSGEGSANFDFRPKDGADFSFVADVKNVNIHSLAEDLASPTNHLEGELNAHLVVTSANSEDWRTWNGYGKAGLHDGLLWDFPIFGILSPVLNTILPGAGNSRATDASARFDMTNGVIFTDSLEIHSTMMRLQYAGTVDLGSRVNARVTAELLRDVWGIGPLFSTALWPVSKLFEYQVTGTLKHPISEPVYIPKFLLMPLHPIRSLEGIFSGGQTNAPPEK
jgi:AsmA-like C-terminal region